MKNSPLLVAFAVLIPGFVSCQCCGSDDPAPREANTATSQDEEAGALALRDMQMLKASLVHFQSNNGGSCPDKLDRLIEKDSNGKAYLQMANLPRAHMATVTPTPPATPRRTGN
ncbi:MAG: hypothetical protein P1V35_01785 [Planctomycetota bacterium]|nr:hypothetical protein [Planctomycetota bacterium]